MIQVEEKQKKKKRKERKRKDNIGNHVIKYTSNHQLSRPAGIKDMWGKNRLVFRKSFHKNPCRY